MNKLTKLGLATLAGSLVASSANAGASVTGKAKIEYKSQDDDEVTGNPLTIDRGLVFAASGDLDNGMTAGYLQKLSRILKKYQKNGKVKKYLNQDSIKRKLNIFIKDG